MTNSVFPTFQSQYISDFSSASRSGTLGFAKHPRYLSLRRFSIRNRCTIYKTVTNALMPKGCKNT
jgi:hypothetical protein